MENEKHVKVLTNEELIDRIEITIHSDYELEYGNITELSEELIKRFNLLEQEHEKEIRATIATSDRLRAEDAWSALSQANQLRETIAKLAEEVERLKEQQLIALNNYCNCTASELSSINGKFICNNCNKEYKSNQ